MESQYSSPHRANRRLSVDDWLNAAIIADSAKRFNQPHLLVQPNADQGLTLQQATTIEAFIISNTTFTNLS